MRVAGFGGEGEAGKERCGSCFSVGTRDMSVVSYDDATPCSLAVAPFLLFDDVLVPGAVFVQKPQFFLPALIFYVLSLVRTLFILYPTDLGPRERFVGSGIPLRCCCTSTHFRFSSSTFCPLSSPSTLPQGLAGSSIMLRCCITSPRSSQPRPRT